MVVAGTIARKALSRLPVPPWRGRMTIEFRDHRVVLEPGEFCVVPRGVEHRTMADTEAEVLIFEPASTRNTGNVVDEKFTAPDGVVI